MNPEDVSSLVQGQLQHGFQQILSEVKTHISGLLQAQAQQAASPCPAAANSSQPVQKDSDDETEEDDPWGGVLPSTRRTPLGAGTVLAQRLSCPPRLDGVKEQMKTLQFVQGVPPTIPPRRHRTDRALYVAQSKLEGAMSLMVDVAEEKAITSGPLLAAAALVRSSYDHGSSTTYLGGLSGKQAGPSRRFQSVETVVARGGKENEATGERQR